MFNWLRNLATDIRIAHAYGGYETQCRKQWVAEAQRTFSTASLEQEIEARMAEPTRHVSATYTQPIQEFESRRDGTRKVVADAQQKLAILRRDYRGELDAADKELKQAKEDLAECRRNLSGAWVDFHSARASLDAWYARAEGNWFGNGGRELPRHAFFGQDLADRDYYKSERDSAWQAINAHKAERAKLERRQKDAHAKMQRVKAAQQAMVDLRKKGFDRRIVRSAIDDGNRRIASAERDIARLAEARDGYLQQVRRSLGILDLEAQIQRLRDECDARIKAFDDEASVAERKATHRAEWLKARDCE